MNRPENRRETSDARTEALISEQGAAWWTLLNSGSATAADHREFGEWVARSPEHVAAYLRTVRLLRALKSASIRWPDVPAEELIREARAETVEVVPFFERPSSGLCARTATYGGRLRRFVSLAAAVLLLVGAATFFATSSRTYSTAIGEQRSVVLEDGSVVTLNTSSAIEVAFRKNHRIIRLLAGEALFQVAHDRNRPFDVIAGGTTVRAVGTQFNVERTSNSTTITVMEGQVTLLPSDNRLEAPAGQTPGGGGNVQVMLAASERIVVSDLRFSVPQRVTDLAATTAWTQRRLIFEHRPLGEVAQEFNRYNHRRILIVNEQLRAQEVTGVFQADDTESFLSFLGHIAGVKIVRTNDEARVE